MSRLFIAIDLPDPIKTSIANICVGVKGAKWVPVNQVHLTLRFIGDVDDRTYEDIQATLKKVHVPAFTIDISGVGYFPPRGKPRTLWVGTRHSESLLELHEQIEQAVVGAGLEPEKRKFHPHITVARLRERSAAKELVPFLSGNSLFAHSGIPVNTFYLYSSILKPQGAIHRREETYEL